MGHLYPNAALHTVVNLSILNNGHAKAVRFSTLEALCAALDCQPGDLLGYDSDRN
jgi:putative transcriptional regulator